MRRPKLKRLRPMTYPADAVFFHVTGHVHKGESTAFAAVSITERDEGGLIIEVDRFEGEVTVRAPGGVELRLTPRVEPRLMPRDASGGYCQIHDFAIPSGKCCGLCAVENQRDREGRCPEHRTLDVSSDEVVDCNACKVPRG